MSMKTLSVVVTAGLICASTFANAAQTVAGKVTKVRDADTVVVNGVPIRLNGIDAPENGTLAGNEATAAMKRYLRGKTLNCELNGDRTYDRWVGVCFTDEGHDIGAVMVANGFALDCRRYSDGRYRSLEPAGARSRLPQSRYC
ncbi:MULTISPECIES: thermonuclease family protein [Rhodobacterales]|uniref:thermonuclease family protein n=1 Tax=Rhodobacterales TaxID=204455 RepID=UPI003296E6CF